MRRAHARHTQPTEGEGGQPSPGQDQPGQACDGFEESPCSGALVTLATGDGPDSAKKHNSVQSGSELDHAHRHLRIASP